MATPPTRAVRQVTTSRQGGAGLAAATIPAGRRQQICPLTRVRSPAVPRTAGRRISGSSVMATRSAQPGAAVTRRISPWPPARGQPGAATSARAGTSRTTSATGHPAGPQGRATTKKPPTGAVPGRSLAVAIRSSAQLGRRPADAVAVATRARVTSETIPAGMTAASRGAATCCLRSARVRGVASATAMVSGRAVNGTSFPTSITGPNSPQTGR